MDETTLFKSARSLDAGALMAIFDLYAPVVYRYCFRLCLDPVESDILVGDVFARFLKDLAMHKNRAIHLRLCIFQITYQTVIECMNTGPQEIVVAGKRIEHGQASARTQSDSASQLAAQVLLLLKTDLTAVQQHVLLLRYLEGFSLSEIAFIVGKSISNVKVIQNRAITKLRKLSNFKDEDRPRQSTSNLET